MRQTRSAFTLIEMLVSMALTLVIMAILSQAFLLGLETFSGLKGLGDMQQNMRTALIAIRADLAADHLEGDRRLSDVSIFNANTLPQAGFFGVKQGSGLVAVSLWNNAVGYTVGSRVTLNGTSYVCILANTNQAPPNATYWAASNAGYVLEGTDAQQTLLPSSRAADHILYFTVKAKGNRQENFYTAVLQDSNAGAPALAAFFSKATAFNIAPTQLSEVTLTRPYNSGSTGYYSSQWAEVVYYLVPSPAPLWNSSTGYSVGSQTNFNGQNYVCVQANTGQIPTNATYWAVSNLPYLYADPNPNPIIPGTVPLYSLYRAQFVMVPDATSLNAAAISGGPVVGGVAQAYQNTFQPLSCNVGPAGSGSPMTFYSPADAAKGLRTIFNLGTLARPSAPLYSSTLLLPNVVSFQVQVMPTGGATFMDLPNVPGGAYANGVYDTTLFGSTTNNTGLKAIQVTLRIFDPNSRQTRQATIVQDL